MLTLYFYRETVLDISSEIPEMWSGHVSQTEENGSGYLVGIEVPADDSSYRYRALMQKPQLVLKFSLPFFFEFPVGTFCTFQNQHFFLTRSEDLKKQGTRNIEYTMTLYTNEYYFGVWKLRNIVDSLDGFTEKDNRLKFSYCAKPHEFIDLIVRNLNNKDISMTWERGDCLEASEKTVEFNHAYIAAALSDICTAFETEYEVEYVTATHAKIHLKRVEYFKDQPVALAYGVGNGFVPGVGRTAEADGEPVKRMLVQGTDRNIDRSTYGAPELLLPISQTIRFDGTYFEDEDGFNADIARTYQSDEDGNGVERIDVVSDAVKEDSLDCTEIYPSRVGEVTEVIVADEDNNFYDIVDDSIPQSLNFNNYLIEGETMTIIFQDGMLSGKEFDVKYIHESKSDGTPGRRFEIVPQEIDGVTMPDATWCPKVGQTYAVFGIQLPDEYICNNETKSGASWDMMRAAVRSLYDNEDQKFTFSGTLQGLWAKRHWLEVGGYLVVGGHVLFTDAQFAKGGVVIRITGIKDFLTDPYSPTIELSNSVSGGSSVATQIRQIDNVEVVIDDTRREIIQYTKRRFRDTLETIGMLEDARLDGFSASISPIAIQTMALLVGDESLQFKFVGYNGGKYISRSNLIYYNNDKKQLFCTMSSGGMQIYLQHMTLGQDSITSSGGREQADYMRWPMLGFASPVLDEPKTSYYLYAKVSSGSTDESGEFVLSPTAIEMNGVTGYYHLLCGVLNSEIDGSRSFVTLYGFTEILPGRITTDLIVSGDGESYFNIEKNIFRLGDRLSFNTDGGGVLRLNGTLVQSPDGTEAPLPCFRGAYSSKARYYAGDVVTYASGGLTSSYMCTATDSAGILDIPPVGYASSDTYWQVYAQGSVGADAPIMVFRGNYDSSATYYGNASRVDCVKSGSAFYVALRTAPGGTVGFTGKDVSDGDYWKSFGASFESVATSLLLAENATIGNWFISGDCIASTHGTLDGVESDDYTASGFRPDVVLDGASGELVLYSDRYPRVRISNRSVKTMFNESLVNESAVSRSGTKAVSPYFMSADLNHAFDVGTLCTILIGQMNEGAKIKISEFSASYCVPAHSTDSAAVTAGSINGTEMVVYVKKDGETVGTLTGISGTSASCGKEVSHALRDASYTVPEGGSGSYTLECRLTVRLSSSVMGQLDSFSLSYCVEGSYTHAGFNRTVIGNDGIGSFWENAAFAFSTDGFQVKCGTVGLKVSSSGIYKTSDWTTDTPTWNAI